MLAELFPRAHGRYLSLPVLGPHIEGFVVWLYGQGYPHLPVRRRVHAARRLDGLLWRQGVRRPGELTAAGLLKYAPVRSQDDMDLAAVVRSLTRYFEQCGIVRPTPPTATQRLIDSYRIHLERHRGLAASTVLHHTATASEFLQSVGYDGDPDHLQRLGRHNLEDFIHRLAIRRSRASLQHVAAHLRAFLWFLAGSGCVSASLASQVDTPRIYRGERLPRSLPWQTVLAFLDAIDRSTTIGRRDYAMFLLIATYGLRASEVVTLSLDDVEWRAMRIRVPRPKVGRRLVLPLTEEVGAAMINDLRHSRPDATCREVFLRVRPPAGTLKPTAVTEAFQAWTRRSRLLISFQGPHCLRHSLAMHLLQQGTRLKTIGDLLGHRSVESTCVYLRLDVNELRDVALDLPTASGEEGDNESL